METKKLMTAFSYLLIALFLDAWAMVAYMYAKNNAIDETIHFYWKITTAVIGIAIGAISIILLIISTKADIAKIKTLMKK